MGNLVVVSTTQVRLICVLQAKAETAKPQIRLPRTCCTRKSWQSVSLDQIDPRNAAL